MDTHSITKLVRAGEYAAEVEVQLVNDPASDSWNPYLTPADAKKLDDIRAALKRGDIAAAAELGRVYRLEAVAKTA